MYARYLFFCIISLSFCTSVRAQDIEKVPVLISHGLAGSKYRPSLIYTAGNEELLSYFYQLPIETFKQKKYLFDRKLHEVVSFNYDDVLIELGHNGSIPNPFDTSIAQKNDMQALSQALGAIKRGPVVGFGHSRGAATWLTLLGQTRPHNKIGLLILEAPFALVQNGLFFSWLNRSMDIVHRMIETVDVIGWCEWFFNCVFWNYQFDEPQPLATVCHIDKSIPILLVHSKDDTIISINDSRNIYNALKESGHDVYLFECDQGDHTLIMEFNDCSEYAYLVHELFRKYQLPFNPAYVNKITDLSRYQPSTDVVSKRIAQSNMYAIGAVELQEEKMSTGKESLHVKDELLSNHHDGKNENFSINMTCYF